MKFHADSNSVKFKVCKNPSSKFWYPPVCLNCKSESGCKDVQPSKRSKKGGVKGSVALLKESFQSGCASHDSHPRKSILLEEGKLGSNDAARARGTTSLRLAQKIRTKLRFTFLLKPGQRRRPLQNLLRNENSSLSLEHQCTC